ncbi:myotubularin-related protein 13-like isoform X3 [Anneissia japonica]|uniref:myotubularin-related protein 13-like isoform X3 n=1 Tax=Anneissia japonica TaxID=1529436 RepID=UPI001425AF97|nr:myotubularin-related protein 13-like isoform X3 [Anneissia japonica]
MSRLADYFVVVGYDHEKEQGRICNGKILQRFPEQDWKNVPFHQGLELFCQPGGWRLRKDPFPPTFHISILTDVEAGRHYCGILTFSEPLKMTPMKPDDLESDELESSLVHNTVMYAPKSILLVSRLNYIDTFKNCLGLIYTSFIERMDVKLELLVGNILGHIVIPAAGGSQVRFSIGAGDRQAIQPPLSEMVPVTRSTVALLFQQLGIQNVITLFSLALTDNKILFHSSSYTRLTDACTSILALLYPFKYCYVYIPVLPEPLKEVLNTPTPFIMGVHSDLKNEIAELLDVTAVDLDGGTIIVPDCVNCLQPPEYMLEKLHRELTMVLCPDLQIADLAFPPSSSKGCSKPEFLDKEIRAIFMRLQVEMLLGYRLSLTIIRIHPKPVISFNKGLYLMQRGLFGEEFLSKLYDSMSFVTFVNERGPPYRICDIFDKLVANYQRMLIEEEGNQEKVLKNIKEISLQLYQNENPSPEPYVQKIPRPSETSLTDHQPFPRLNREELQEIISGGVEMAKVNPKLKKSIKTPKTQVVPIGPLPKDWEEQKNVVNNSARRLEVLRTCISHIFENKLLDARKMFPTVLRSLKSRVVREVLAKELALHVQENRAMLEMQQFDMVVKLINCSLQEDSSVEEFTLARRMLPLSVAFCRKLCTGIIQFAYSCVQDHPVWATLSFWENAFYAEVEKGVTQLYISAPSTDNKANDCDTGIIDTSQNGLKSNEIMRSSRQSPLEVSAERLKLWPDIGDEDKSVLMSNEEGIVYSQAIHFANHMVCMRVPLDTKKRLVNSISMEGESCGSSNLTSSAGGSDSYEGDGSYDSSDTTTTVTKFVSKFVDKVCTESGVTSEPLKKLHSMIPGIVAMHIEMLEAVHRESKRLPPIKKPKILKPVLLQGERILFPGYRGYLLPDGREEGIGGNIGGPALLPAEGALFITNYRIVFKGNPVDIQACELAVIRSFPLASLFKEKKISVGNLVHLDHYLQEGIQIRSNTFQLIKFAFDEEVGSEKVEQLRRSIGKMRFPPAIYETFAFQGTELLQINQTQKQTNKNATLKRFAKNTLMRVKGSTLGRAQQQSTQQQNRRQKYILPVEPLVPRRLSSSRLGASNSMESLSTDSDSRPSSVMFDDDDLNNIDIASASLRASLYRSPSDTSTEFSPVLGVIDEADVGTLKPSDTLSPDKLHDKLYVQDYKRLGLGCFETLQKQKFGRTAEGFRLTDVNIHYEVARSYPGLVAVPGPCQDDSIRRLSRCYRNNRFPVVVWRHPKTKALLLRSGGFHGKGVMGMIKSSTQATQSSNITSADGGVASKSIEQEKYFMQVIANSSSSVNSASLLSLNKIASNNSLDMQEASPRLGTKRVTTSGTALFQRSILRSSGGKATQGTLRSGGRANTLALPSRASFKSLTLGYRAANRNGSITDVDHAKAQEPRKADMYVFGEKSQLRTFKLEGSLKCDFIPYEFNEVRQVKASFKKFMKACIPSAVSKDPEMAFLKLVEDSEWLPQIKTVMQLAGAVVDLIDCQGSSVMVSFEDGWDFTTQVVSLAELLMDPYYRTFEGFKVLIEKEWLAFGHRFTHRSNHTLHHQASGFAPVFLQFVDCVHQVHRQFPMSFEFNQHFLQMLAYHYVSNRFKTFMLDSEYERFEVELYQVISDDRPRMNRIDEAGDQESKRPDIRSFWEYVDQLNEKSTIFYNVFYSEGSQSRVLRPYANISSLKIWDFYLNEHLSCGPAFDCELFDAARNEDNETPLSPADRCVVNACYQNVAQADPDMQRWLLNEIIQLETDLNVATSHWRTIINKFNASMQSKAKLVSPVTEEAKAHGTSIHKKITMDILRGKSGGESPRGFASHHRFESHDFQTPTNCDACHQVIWSYMKQGTGMRCADCGFSSHEKCITSAPKQCLRRGSSKEPSNTSSKQTEELTKSVPINNDKDPNTYLNFAARIGETVSHKGYLYKRGARLRQWKQRYFKLDPNKHQLRYYDTDDVQTCKGTIDLKEVESVKHDNYSSNLPGVPKLDDNSFIYMKTSTRDYHFLAKNKKEADEWINKIQDCITN